MWFLSTIRLITRISARVIYSWLWWIPTRLTLIAIAGYFGLMYVLFGSVHVYEIKEYFGGNKWGYLFGFNLPIGWPMLVSFISMMAQGKGSETSLQRAIRFRNGQMRIKPPKEASKILKQTSMLDLIENSDSDVMESAKRGFEAEYRNSSPTKVFKDFMGDDG